MFCSWIELKFFTWSIFFSEKFLSQLWTQQKFVLEEHCYYSAHLEYISGPPAVHSCWWLVQAEVWMAWTTYELFLLLSALPITFLLYSGANISTSLENSSGVLHPFLFEQLWSKVVRWLGILSLFHGFAGCRRYIDSDLHLSQDASPALFLIFDLLFYLDPPFEHWLYYLSI